MVRLLFVGNNCKKLSLYFSSIYRVSQNFFGGKQLLGVQKNNYRSMFSLEIYIKVTKNNGAF